ncbi:MAG: tetratricopeptide repeat protein [Phycisphaerales bacterium]
MSSILPAAEALYFAGKLAEAQALLRRHLQRSPRDHAAAFCLANILLEEVHLDQAAFYLKAAIRDSGGTLPAYWQALAKVQAESTQLPEAVASARRAVDLAPASADAHAALGDVLVRTGAFAEAARAFERAIQIEPNHRVAHVHLADLPLVMGDPETAAARAEKTALATVGDPNHFLQCATAAVFSVYAGDCTMDEVYRRHARVGAVLAKMPPPAPGPLTNAPDPERPLRMAFLSPDFIQHSCAYFVETLLDHLDRARFAPVALFASRTSDHVTKRLRTKFASWHDLPTPTDTQVQAILRSEKIDIAIDLAGYTVASILWPLRARLAPVQVSWLGYPCTTAIPTVDARFVDSLTDPTPRSDTRHTERLIRLDPCFICYRPPIGPTDPGCPAVSPMPGLAPSSPFTLGSFNLLGKLSGRTKDLWARILREVPGTRLVLKDAALEHEEARAFILSEFVRRGIDAGRIDLLAKTKTRDEHLALYSRIDLALDPFPYNGTTTTCEAMFMGVPPVSLVGPPGLHAGRVGLSLLSAVGLQDHCAATEDGCLSLVARLAANRPALAALRSQMRLRLLASPLCDGPGYTRRFEGALRGLWREWCAQHG